jgi:hypothetical protein
VLPLRPKVDIDSKTASSFSTACSSDNYDSCLGGIKNIAEALPSVLHPVLPKLVTHHLSTDELAASQRYHNTFPGPDSIHYDTLSALRTAGKEFLLFPVQRLFSNVGFFTVYQPDAAVSRQFYYVWSS